MSRSTYLVCRTCGEYLWIGQSEFIYTGDAIVLQRLQEFLQKHRTENRETEHELLFMPEPYNGSYEDEKWEEMVGKG